MRAVALLGACVLVFAACSKAGVPAQPHGSTLVVAVPAEPVSLNPLYLEGELGYVISELGYSYLTNYDAHGSVVPDLANQVPTLANGGISRDGTRITYRLRRGVRWADGAALTSRDVAFTYRAIMNPANAIPSRYGYDRVAGVDAPDDRTVVVRLRSSYSPIVSYFFGGDSNYPILPAHLLAALRNLNHASFGDAPVGSGPYAFARWSRGDYISAKANPSYFAGRPAIDRVTLRFLHDSSTTVAQLMTREVDATFFADVTRIATLREIPDHRIVVTPVPYFYALLFNVTDPLVGDRAVRRAFAGAIDRRALVAKMTHGLYDAGTGMRGLFTWAFDPRVGNVPYDPRAAEAALASEGWIPGPDGIRVKGGRRLELELALRTGMEIDAGFATLIAAQERAVGIDVTLKQYAREQFLALGGPITQGRYQIALYGYQSSYDPDVSWLLACSQRGPHGFNDARYCNAAVDRALRDAAASFDRATRARDYRFVQRQILTDLPYEFLCQISEIDVIPSRLQGYDPPLLSPFRTIARWHFRP
jgi:peptide/nickel transport system substrate-binding protein